MWSLPDLQGKCSHYGRFRATMCHKNWESAHTFSSRAYAPLGSSHQWATKPCTHPGATCLGVRTLPQTFQTSLCSLLRSLKNEVGGVSEVICAVLTGPRSPTSQMKKLRPRDVKDPSQPLHEHKGWKRTGGNAQGKPSRKISWGLPAPALPSLLRRPAADRKVEAQGKGPGGGAETWQFPLSLVAPSD